MLSERASCVFCKIASGEIAAQIVARDQVTVAFSDINPQAPLHVLLIPIEHYADAHSVPGATLEAMPRMVARVAAEGRVADTGYRMVFNLGRDAGQTVPHAHLHVLGGRLLTWPPG